MVDFSKLLNSTNIPVKVASSTTGNVDGNPQTAANSTINANSATKKLSITLNGKVHSLVISEDGTRYDFNETDQSWAVKKGNDHYFFQDTDRDSNQTGKTIDLSKVDVEKLAIISATEVKNYNLADQTKISNYDALNKSIPQITQQTQTNQQTPAVQQTQTNQQTPTVPQVTITQASNYTVAVVDDFHTVHPVLNASNTGQSVNIGISHGNLVEAILKEDNDKDTNTANDVKVLEFDAYDTSTSGLSYKGMLTQLNNIETKINAGEKIDAINLSISDKAMLSDLGLSSLDNLTTAQRQNAINKITNSDVVSIINKITELGAKGVDIYISAGNEADDFYGIKNSTKAFAYQNTTNYTKFKQADSNLDNEITQGELYNYLNSKGYNKNNDNIVTGKEMGFFNRLTLASGKNIHVIGSTDSMTDGNKTDGVADYSNENALVDANYNGDVFISHVQTNYTTGQYGYDIDNDGKVDFWANASDVERLFDYGTSFASPLAAKINDTRLA